ncbi:MAG: minor capsid protein [Butyrivibrio sp.]|nr:minor capsid protein [Butyrivibrio sp.]
MKGKIRIDAVLNIDAKKLVKRLGMEKDGTLQKLVDNEVIRECDPYVPHAIGTLRESASVNTVIGSGRVVYKTPYARRLYYNPQYHFNYAPTRGGMWFHRAMANGGRKRISKALEAAVAKRLRRRS